jgi:hypothetical protein
MALLHNNDNSTKQRKRTVTEVVGASTQRTMFRSASMSMAPPPHCPEDPPKVLQKSHSSPMRPYDHNPASSAWVWKMNQLLPVPTNHPLERTALTIENLKLDTLTARISEFMKIQSIACSYHSDEGRVYCLTDCLLKFVVQLWQGSANDHIIMEVQRRQGCCIEMQRRRNQLIQAILSGESSQPEQKQARTTCEFLETFLDTTASLLPPRRECLPKALEICRQLLKSEHLDENRLGLESLYILTDPSKVFAEDANQASSVILLDSSFHDLFEKYFSHIELIHNEPMDADDSNGYAILEYEQGQFFGCLHLLALKVLSHALESAAWKHQSSRISVDLSSLFWGTVLQALYCNLKVASRRPLEASLSIRCLRLLQTLEPTTILNMATSRRRLRELLLSAHQYGRQHGRSLEQETGQLMQQIGFVL